MNRAQLSEALAPISGYFSLDEAWALNRAVATIPRSADVRVVEIGSYKGRSTVAIGLALSERHGGHCVSVDPHAPTGKESYVREHGGADTFDEYLANIRRSGVERYIESVRATSEVARASYDGTKIDVLFIDGSHDFEDVKNDIALWTPLLKRSSIVAFNDPFSPGVNRAIGAYIAMRFRVTAFVDAYHVNNTLFLVEDPSSAKRVSRLALSAYLFAERQSFKLLKLALKGVFESLRIVYVRPE